MTISEDLILIIALIAGLLTIYAFVRGRIRG